MNVWDRIDTSSVIVEREIGDMVSGEYGWTVPWAMDYTEKGCSLDSKYTISQNMEGDTGRLFVFKDTGEYYAILFDWKHSLTGHGYKDTRYIPCKFATYDKVTEAHISSLSPNMQSVLRSLLK